MLKPGSENHLTAPLLSLTKNTRLRLEMNAARNAYPTTEGRGGYEISACGCTSRVPEPTRRSS